MTSSIQLPTKIARLPEVKAQTGLPRSTIYLWMSKGFFPRSIDLGPRSVGWIKSEIDDWIATRIVKSRQNSINANDGDKHDY